MKRERQWYIIGCYLFPNDALTILCVLVDVVKLHCWSKLLVARNFNAELTGPEGAEQDKEFSADLAASGLEDMLEEFHTYLCPWNQEKGMWSMFGVVREVGSRTDYILYMDRCLFRNMSTLDCRNNLDNYLILGYLHITTLREHENSL